jgi:hypothetical protein
MQYKTLDGVVICSEHPLSREIISLFKRTKSYDYFRRRTKELVFDYAHVTYMDEGPRLAIDTDLLKIREDLVARFKKKYNHSLT